MSRAGRAGFTLIELLVVVAVIGILIAIAVPIYLAALDRSRQAQTIENMRSIATNLHQYQVDCAQFPVANDVDDMAAILLEITETPIRFKTDGWNNEFLYDCDTGKHYSLSSMGADGQGTHGNAGGFDFMDFNKEITVVDGEFVQKPR